jgi:AcrR family transcriptional regulator
MLCYDERMVQRAAARDRTVPAARKGARGAAPPKVVAKGDPPRTRLDVDERRRQLVALGLELFSEQTYDEVSIDELAQAAGISKGLLYHYFPTKRDFYVATVREAAHHLLECTETPEGMDPMARLEAGLDRYIEYVGKHGKPYQALLRSGVGADPEVAAIVEGTREKLCARLLEGAPVGVGGDVVRLALRGWLGFVEAVVVEWLDARRVMEPIALRTMLVQVLVGAVSAASAVERARNG